MRPNSEQDLKSNGLVGSVHEMCPQPKTASRPVNKSVQWSGRVVVIGDSLRCDRNGTRQIGIGGVLARSENPSWISTLVEFARALSSL